MGDTPNRASRPSATEELRRTSQLYLALSALYQGIVHSQSSEELFKRVTKALVESGAIRMAWVGWADEATQRLLPVAQFGDEDGYLQAIEIRIDDSPKGRGPSGTAFRTGQPYLLDDMMSDPVSVPWRGEAEKRKWRAAAAFPLHCRGVAQGVLTVYAHEPSFFRDEKLSVLLNAASDISSALDRLAQEGERKRLEEANSLVAKRLELALDAAEIGVWDWNIETGQLVYDDRMYAMHGLAPGSTITYQTWAKLVHPDDLLAQRRALQRVVDEGIVGRCQFRIVLPNGQIRHMYSIETLRRDAQGRPANVVGINFDVTDRVEAAAVRQKVELQLRESQQHYRMLFDSSPNAKALIDVATRRIIEVNETVEKMFGYERDELIGMHADELFDPRDLLVVERERQRDDRDTLARTMNLKLVRKNGSTFYAEIATRQVELESKAVTLAVAWDVTARVEAEHQLRKSQERYQLVFEANPDPMALVDVETSRILVVNDAAVKQTGWSREELTGMHVDQLSRPEDLPAIRLLRQARQNFRSDFKQVRKDGSMFDAEASIRQIELDGRPTNLSVIRDVTARLEAERRMRESQQRYQQVFEANPDPITLIDAETYRILAVNEAMVRQYGWSREELTGMHVDRLSRPEDLPAIRRMRETHQTLRTGFKQVRKDGSLFDSEISVNRIELDSRPVNLGVVRDVTARLDAERQRDSVGAQLQQSQKMEAVGQLTGGVAHDFNNILMVILGNVEELLEDETLSSQQRTMLQDVASSGERAAELTRRLLAFSRKQRLAPELTNINDLVASMSKMLRRTLGENIEMGSVLANDLGVANVDRAQVESALLNLSVNARDAMPGGGRLIIETANQELEEEYAKAHPEVEPGSYVMLAVSDTGAGISPENLQRVFEPFFTTKAVGKGTGLGLSMVYGFVKQSKGHVKIYSEVGRGTTIRIYLPRVEAELKPDAERAALLPRGDERILVVEDDDLVRQSVVVQLRSLGYEVAEFAHGRQALEWLDRGGQSDLVLTDVVMPEMDGPTVARVAEKLRPGIKILFMSGYSENSPVLHNSVPPGADLLSKPFRKIDLAKRIRDVLTQKRRHPENVDENA